MKMIGMIALLAMLTTGLNAQNAVSTTQVQTTNGDVGGNGLTAATPTAEPPAEVPAETGRTEDADYFDHIAAGDVNALRETDVNHYRHSSGGETPLTLAIQQRDVDMVRELMRDAVINVRNQDGETPLTLALKTKQPEIIRLVAQRAKTDLKNAHHETPLYLAVELNDLHLLELLLSKGADVNRLSEGNTALSRAVELDLYRVVGYLIRSGADVNLPNVNGDIPLYLAIKHGHDICAGILLDKSNEVYEDVNWSTAIDETLLNIAIERQRTEIVRLMLKAGARANQLDYAENTPLHIAAETGNVDIAKMLLAATELDLNHRNLRGETPLLIAGSKGHQPLVQLLVEAGADAQIRDYLGNEVDDYVDVSHRSQPKSSEVVTETSDYSATGALPQR